MPKKELSSHLNKLVRLEFADGEVIEAVLLGVDPDRDHDLTYEVLKILRPASPAARGTAVGATCVAQLNHLISWQVAGGRNDDTKA